MPRSTTRTLGWPCSRLISASTSCGPSSTTSSTTRSARTTWRSCPTSPGATSVDLGTAAVIMPWNDPLRVAERIALLDQVSGGRVRFGMGRGLSRREFANFGAIEMDESRERFDEGSMMVKEALETGLIEGAGRFFPQPKAPIRPAPAQLRRPPLRGGVLRRLDRGGGPPQGPHDDVLGPLVVVAPAEHRPLARAVPRVPRRGAAGAADLRLRVLLGRRRRRARPAVHGRLPRVGARALRDHGRPLRGPQGLRRLRHAPVLRRMGDRLHEGLPRRHRVRHADHIIETTAPVGPARSVRGRPAPLGGAYGS